MRANRPLPNEDSILPPAEPLAVSTGMLEPTDWVDTVPGFFEELLDSAAVPHEKMEGLATREVRNHKIFKYFFG